MPSSKDTAAVVVLGELARSPRMLNHARALDAAGFDTVLIGYGGRNLDTAPSIRVRPLHAMDRVEENRSRAVFIFGSTVRMSLLLFELIAALIRERPKIILVQNAPAFPTLIAAWIGARLARARLIVDWHNYSYSLLALRLGPSHIVTRIFAWYEGASGRRGDAHFCVSQAMRKDLASRWRIRAATLYDRALQLERLDPDHLTVVCPAGWTKDEDMDLLLDAIARLEASAIRFHLTGDGPLRASLEPRIDQLRARGFAIHTGFLPESDYRALIRRASLGLSLHRSSSGLDLAMKVVDFLGASVPVCALDYGGALPEQIRPGENGFVFRTAEELAAILADVAANPQQLDALRPTESVTWADEWTRVALPALSR